MSQHPIPGQFCWSELITEDVDAAKQFYHSVFGWNSRDMNFGETTYTLFSKGENEFAGMIKSPIIDGTPVKPNWLSYILVEDIEAALRKANEHGAKTIVPITVVPNTGTLCVITDPTGAHLGFWMPKAPL